MSLGPLEEGEEGSSQGGTFEVRTIISIKQGHHCPLHPQVKPKDTRTGDVNGSFFGQIKVLSLGPFPVLVYGFLPVKEPTYNIRTDLYATSYGDGILDVMVNDSQKYRVRVILHRVNW